MAAVRVTVNGEPMELEPGASVADLLERLRVGSPRVAAKLAISCLYFSGKGIART